MEIIMLLLNKYVIYSIIIGILAGAGILYVYQWEASIKREATLEFNNRQLLQSLADQKKYDEDLKAVNDIQKKSLEEMGRQNQELTSRLSGVTTYLDSPQAKMDSRGSSSVLKKTIESLKASQ